MASITGTSPPASASPVVCCADNPAEPKIGTSWRSCPGSARIRAPPPADCAPRPAHTGEPPHKPPLETPPAILFGPRKGQLLKWPAFTPPRAAALCRRPVADYSTAAYTVAAQDTLAAVFDHYPTTGSTKDISTGVNGVGQKIIHRRVDWGLPQQLMLP